MPMVRRPNRLPLWADSDNGGGAGEYLQDARGVGGGVDVAGD